MAGVTVAPRVRDLTELSAQLTGWLSLRLPGATDIRIENLSYPSGAGMSHETILFDASWSQDGRRASQGMVVRVKPVANAVFVDDLFDKQYQVMRVLHDNRWVRVAEPLWLEADPGVIGAPFFVMKKVRGRVAVSRPPYAQEGWVFDATPAQRRKLWENGVRALASVHKAPIEAFGFLAGPEGARSGLEQEWDKYARFVEWVSQDHRWPVLDAGLARLRERWPKNQPPGLVWGGAELVNLMFDDDFEVVAVMDWEQPSLGGPLNDLGWWLYMADMKHGPASGRPPLDGMGTREETIALWSELTGLSGDDVDWYEDFMALKVGCLAASSAKVWGLPPPDHTDLARRLHLTVG